ncbi:uroporphyrinogen-III synthase [Methylonatrum kenyense]|uniref:uroporphyrinogen-III synthase n=1 Tax=Methylonatrum kenyense TaxID=455253 RepID=UPI0020BD8A6D|nr:uroporphyrinogen-III synthase [Methylonatrum kenyense]MCK8516114.1 uroporphyrinogen-III synthase [Methylonatrum kenyense]
MTQADAPLTGLRVALAESRELDLFADMLRCRGAETLRCPLVTIRDTPDRAAVEAWLQRFIQQRPDWLILLTGEGLRRLNGFAERAGLLDAFHEALATTPTLTRGPKPGRALRPLDLKPHLLAESPTTAGVIRSLQTLELDGARVAVQLYGQEPNPALMQALLDAGAEADPVSPYIYTDDLDDPAVLTLLDRLRDGEVDCIAFTSKSQVSRLFTVAEHAGRVGELRQALSRVLLASIGPVVTDALARHGISADLQPEQSYFMKPLVRELIAARRGGRAAATPSD